LIFWLSGNTGSGKTYLANKLLECIDAIHLDGNEMRNIWLDLKLTKEDRWENNLRIARLAKILSSQNNNIIISVIAPYRKLREEIDKICKPVWIYLPSTFTNEQPYESAIPREKN